jgi:hypothetical protein
MCIPAAIEKCKVQAYIFQGYWEDIGNRGDDDNWHSMFIPSPFIQSILKPLTSVCLDAESSVPRWKLQFIIAAWLDSSDVLDGERSPHVSMQCAIAHKQDQEKQQERKSRLNVNRLRFVCSAYKLSEKEDARGPTSYRKVSYSH